VVATTSKKEQISTTSTGLQKVKLAHNKNKMPLLLIEEVIDKLKNTKYFNKLDLIWRYNNVQIKEDNE